MSNNFQAKYGPWAFVAGASMGIGRAITREAASRGLNVLLLARGQELLEQVAAETTADFGVETRTLAADLADPAIGAQVADAIADLEVGLFVYNATIAPQGRFLDVDLDTQLRSVAVNCATPTVLCNVLGKPMVARGRGAIALVSSMGGTQGSVNFGTYNAGKAYEWILAETLWAELGAQGVDVTTMFVGPTTSPNYNAFQATLDPTLCGNKDSDDPLDRARARLVDASTPEEVAMTLLDQLGDGPVCYSHPDDAFIAQATFTLSRKDAVGVWCGVQNTATRIADTQAV